MIVMPISSLREFPQASYNDEAWKALMALASKIALQEQSEPAMPHPYIAPTEIISQLAESRDLMEEREAQNERQVHRTVRHTLGKMVYSTTPLDELEPCTLKELKIRHHNQGTYLLCRTISQVSRSNVISIGIEDTNGWSQQLSIYNFPGTRSATTDELDTIFPLFTIMAIREPLIEDMLVGDSSHIRVNSPSDIVFLEGDENPLIEDVTWTSGERTWGVMERSAQEWKDIAGKHLALHQHRAAVVAYTYAMQRDPSMISVRLGRAMSNIHLENYTFTLTDTRFVLNHEDSTLEDQGKALHLTGLANFAAGNYQEAKWWFQELLKILPNLDILVQEVRACDTLEEQRTNGVYDWDEVFKQIALSDNPEVANFIGPVEVMDMPHRSGGRGVVAKRDIAPGELLVVSKAAISSLPYEPLNPESIVHLNLQNSEIDGPSTYSMFQEAMEKISMDPNLADQVYTLYGGEEYPAFPDGVPSSEKRDFSKNPLNVPVDVDPGRILAICSRNAFKHPIHLKNLSKFNEEDGLWCLHIFPSYFNHSCIPNARYAAFPNYLIIRALRVIKEGEEVFLNYGLTGGNFKERTVRLQKWLDACDCPLCRYDRNTPPSQAQKRQELLHQIINSSSVSLGDLKDKVRQIDATFPEDYPNFRWEAFRAQSLLSRILESLRDENKDISFCPDIIQHNMAALEAIGTLVTDKGISSEQPKEGEGPNELPISTDHVPYEVLIAVAMCFEISRRFKVIGIAWRAKQWLKAAIWVDDKEFGGGITLFKRKHTQEIREEYPEIQSLWEEMEAEL
ncbi:hypothetical protein CPB86DRAFT_622538 [Serendipita vermifera]|nr:hypothetical protein CPB86DRAFT_622538 [Serendipita vermifera]